MTSDNPSSFQDLQGLSRTEQSAPVGQPRYYYKSSAQYYRALITLQPDSNGRRRYYWELILYDARGGLNRQVGDFDRDFDRSSESTIDTRFERTGVLPLLLTEVTTPDPAGTQTGIHYAQIFDTTIIATGATNDACLFKETSGTDPTIAAITGAGTGGQPGHSFTCAHPAIFGGSSTAEKLVLGLVGAVPIAITDTSGTLYGTTAHANLNPLWGLIQTFLGNVLFYANGNIYSLDEDADWDTAPTQTVTMRNGGFALGALLLGGGLGTVRAYWAEPDQATTSGCLAFGSETSFHIVSTDFEGYDKTPFLFTPELNRLYWAVIYRDGIVASDLKRVVFKNGSVSIDLHIFDDVSPDSDKQYRARGAWVRGDTLRVRVQKSKTSSGTGNSSWSIMEYDWQSQAWHRVSAWEDNSSTGDFGVMPSGGGLPWSDETGYLHHQIDGSWWRQEWPAPGVNVFGLRKTSGAQSGTGSQFESTGTWTSPKWELPGLEGMTKVWMGYAFLGDLEAGGTGGTAASIAITAAGHTETINANSTNPQTAELGSLRMMPAFDKLQISITATRQSGGTDPTRFTPNIFPVLLWGFAGEDRDIATDPTLPKLPRR